MEAARACMMPLALSLTHALASLVWRGYSRVTEDVRMGDVTVAEATTATTA